MSSYHIAGSLDGLFVALFEEIGGIHANTTGEGTWPALMILNALLLAAGPICRL
ncbi:hypothetical protein [Pararhodospirillum photometricum]|uniref:Uncharacterized protein n=1 Tax=Pararhodospirillum photometricum DSM 122 TaxID=1150469 RepID=H6SLD4_PARPM|nr:hypothetical protein [Pararhodospirillum photometricum]CCG08799.1 unnamed protein product [Pararhodospirillum photometricum DSM 122]